MDALAQQDTGKVNKLDALLTAVRAALLMLVDAIEDYKDIRPRTSILRRKLKNNLDRERKEGKL